MQLLTRRTKSHLLNSSYLMDEMQPACLPVPDERAQALLSCDFIPDGRCQACLIHHTIRTRTSPPFTCLRIRWSKSYLLDSSYWMDEDMPSVRTTSYRMDEVPPALLLVPDGRGQAILSCDFASNGRRPTCLIPCTCTEWTKSCLLYSSYLTDEDKLSFCTISHRTDEDPLA